MSRIIVLGGDFTAHPKARFDQATMVLPAPRAGAARWVRHPPSHVSEFRVCDGVWERTLGEASDWSRALTAAAKVGAAPAAMNLLLPDFFFGQKALVTWLNAVVGGAAATAALKSDRDVRFRVRFNDGANLDAKTRERGLTLRMPQLLTAALAVKR